MKKIFSIALFLISAGNCFGQLVTFQKTFGGIDGDNGASVQQTSAGGYIIVGTTVCFGAGGTDVYLIQADANGDTLWTKTFGGTNYDSGNSVQHTIDDGYIITGQANNLGAGSNDVYLIRTDSNGDTLWTKTFGGVTGEIGNSVQQTIDSGYIMVGYTYSFGAGNTDLYLIKTDSKGDILWAKTFGGIGDDRGNSVQQTTDGGYIIMGYTYSFGAGSADVYLIRTDSNGDSLWTKTFGGVDGEIGNSVQQTMDSGYIMAGYTYSFGAGNADVYLIRNDPNGDTLWTKTYGGTNYDYGYSVQQTAYGGYIITGWTNSFGAGSADVYLIKTDSIGGTLWTKTFGGTGDDDGYSVQQTTDGGYIITGWTIGSGAGSSDIYLIKTDSLGNSGCNEGNTATIVTLPATQVTSPPTIVTSPPTVATTPATIVGSGGTVTTLCTTAGIQPAIQNPQSEISISPNPTTNNFTITFLNTINKGRIEIYNVLGKKIFTENIYNISQKEIHLKPARPLGGNTAAGIYFVKVRDGEKEYCEKLVIEN